ncbi:MAG: hypothetical protein ABFS02_01130 [Pseudomonadota bacterium]
MARKFIIFLLALCCTNPAWTDSGLEDSIRQLELEWAVIYYEVPAEEQAAAYKPLLRQVESLRKQYLDKAEPLIWKAILLCTYAGADGGISALTRIREARDLLKRALRIDPKALDGSAYVTLGTLYYMVPGWPIAFGDDDLARQHLEKALEINPYGIDTNYFYGDYLVSKGEDQRAIAYFEKALSAPVRSDQPFVDAKLKQEVRMALTKAHQPKVSGLKAFLRSLLSSAQAKP